MDAKAISLSETDVKPVVDLLNDYLANYHIHYQKLRGCHWNIKGQNFLPCTRNSRNCTPMRRKRLTRSLNVS